MKYLLFISILALFSFQGCNSPKGSKGRPDSGRKLNATVQEKSASDMLRPGNARHTVVFHEEGKFAGWPANNGIWIWEGKEILVGLTVGPFEVKNGHNLGEPHLSMLARSTDGGESWVSYDPEHFIGDGDPLKPLEKPVDPAAPGFALRVTGIGYHGNVLPEGGFYYSKDRGSTWKGPFSLKGLESLPALDTMELSPRTDYLVNSDGSLQVFISARVPGVFGSDRLFCAKSVDGGQTFRLQGWVVPLNDPYRAVMSSTVRCSASKLVSSVRRREIGTERCWVDVYHSGNNGDSWSFLGKVGDTGPENGNPPALLRLDDGRLVCAYGQRERQQIVARISENEGAEWGPEIVLRNDFWPDEYGNSDLGYPRMVLRADGKIVTIYYWATGELKEQQIAATIWDPDDLIRPE